MDIVFIRGIRHEVHECLTCGCIVAASETLLNEKRRTGGSFFCQNGHSQGWSGNTELDKLRRERDRLKQQAARLEEEKAAASAEALRIQQQWERHKKRVAAGTCPCCKRTFANMARHMKSKHPGFNVVPIKGAA